MSGSRGPAARRFGLALHAVTDLQHAATACHVSAVKLPALVLEPSYEIVEVPRQPQVSRLRRCLYGPRADDEHLEIVETAEQVLHALERIDSRDGARCAQRPRDFERIAELLHGNAD